VNNIDVIKEMFNALDVKKTGRVDFSDFVYAISILQSGSIEERLKFAFTAYDIDHDGNIDPVISYLFQNIHQLL
jgi:Ca2+-binding EF-hand superfamily protein